MRATFWIAMREMRERRVVLAAALVAGLVPFASPLFPGVSAERAGEAREAMATLLALGFGLILALLLGASAIARDLAENRLGFDFARPLGGFAIWGGRLGAAVGLTLAAMAVVAAPAMLAGGRFVLPDHGELEWEFWPVLLGAILFAVGLAHVASVAIRSRSRWLALDLVGLVVVPLLAASGVRRIHDAFAFQTAWFVAGAAVMSTIPILWIASAVQVARGRTDLVRGHRAQAVVLWSSLLVVALGVAGYSLWFVAADVDDLVTARGEPAPDGPWITIDGTGRGRPGLEAQFLLDSATGRSIRLGPGDLNVGNATLYSRDARRAVWLHREGTGDSTLEVSVIDLTASDPRLRTTSIAFDLLMPMRPDLSPSGGRLATLQGRSLAVHDLDTGRILAAATLDEVETTWGRERIVFVDDDRVRVYVFAERLLAYELEVGRRALTSWSGPEIGEGTPGLWWGPDHRRLILAYYGGNGTYLLDGDDGTTIARLAEPGGVSLERCGFLENGRVVLIRDSSPGRPRLDVLSSEGVEGASFELGTAMPLTRFALGAEAVPGALLVLRDDDGARGPDLGRLMLVDLETGRIRDVDGGGRPVASINWVAQHRPARPGSVASRLVQRQDSVWLLDPDSATLRLVAGRPG
jgi:hypothetical protein